MSPEAANQSPFPMPPQGPPTYSCSKSTLFISSEEILLTLGHVRPIVVSPTELSGAVEWMAAFALSATTLKQLALSLQSAVETYEKAFGKIPMDPVFKVNVAQNPTK